MIKSLVKIRVLITLIGCLFVGCSISNNKPVLIGFTADSSAIRVQGINPVGLLELQKQMAKDSTSGEWVRVFTNGKEVHGKVSMLDEEILFFPDTAFEKGQTYLVRTLLNTTFGDTDKVLKGKVSYQIQPQEVMLKR